MPTRISDDAILEIREAVASGETEHAMDILEKWRNEKHLLRFPHGNAAALAAYFAWAVDLDSDYLSSAEDLIAHLDEIPKGSMTLLQLTYLDIAKGLIKLRYERYEEALEHFNLAKFGAKRSNDTELLTVSYYCLARCHLKHANYEKSLFFLKRGQSLDIKSNRRKRAATVDVLEGLVYLLINQTEKAESLFDRAEEQLRGSEDDNVIVSGNLCMFRARIARRRRNYDESEKLYEKSIVFYEKRDVCHRNIARAYIHLAIICRLKALDIEKELIYRRSRSNSSALLPPGLETHEEWKAVRGEMMSRIDLLRGEAFRHLKKAEAIYGTDPERHHQGRSKILNVRAQLYFDMSNHKEAEKSAWEALRLGRQTGDNLMMSKSFITLCMLALDMDDPHEKRAIQFADSAVKYAQSTEHPRLQARAIIWQGQARLSLLNDVQGAKDCLDEAEGLLIRDDQDYLKDDLNDLQEALDRYRSHESEVIRRTLSDLINYTPDDSDGDDSEGKCDLQQLVDEFEEEILRRLYGLEGGVIAKVKNKWRTSPKKVRQAISTHKITDHSLQVLRSKLDEKKVERKLCEEILKKLASLENHEVIGQANLVRLVKKTIGYNLTVSLKDDILDSVEVSRSDSSESN